MQPAARRFVISSRVCSSSSSLIPRSVASEVPTILHRNDQQRSKSVAASVPSGSFKEGKEQKKVSKQERRAMIEAFVDRYRSSHAGRFPTASHTRQHTGGSHYTVRQIIQELEYRHKASPPNKIGEIRVEKAEEVMYTSSRAMEEPASSEPHKTSTSATTRNYTSDEDLGVKSKRKIIHADGIDLDTPQQDVEIEPSDVKNPLFSSDVHKSSDEESVSSLRRAISRSTKQIAETGTNPGISGQTVSDFPVDIETTRKESSSSLANETVEEDVQGSKCAQVISSVKVETTIGILHSPSQETEGRVQDVNSTESLDMTHAPGEAERMHDVGASRSQDLTGDQQRMPENEEFLPERSNVWGNLKAFASGIFNFWKKK